MNSLFVPVTKLLLKSVRDSYDIYNIDPEEQRKLELKLKAEQSKKNSAKETRDAKKNH